MMKIQFEYKPHKKPPQMNPHNLEFFENLIGGWRINESRLLKEMQNSTGLNFKLDTPTIVYESPQDMDLVNGFRVPAYSRNKNRIQTFLMKPERFVATELHENFHRLYDQNWNIVGDFFKDYKKKNNLSHDTAGHVFVHAGMKEVARVVFGDHHKKILDGDKWWEYLPKDSPVVKELGPHYQKSWVISDRYQELMQNFRSYVNSRRV